jgi:hypothetical protein
MNLKLSTTLFCMALFLTNTATAFELKGIASGANLDTVDLKACRAVPDADSGIPGYRCDSTFGGAPANMSLVVADEKIVGVKIIVEGELMLPILEALQEKYGSPRKANRFIEDYTWTAGEKFLSLKESRIGRGYTVLTADLALYRAVINKRKNSVKRDL